MKARFIITLIWLITVTVLLSKLGMTVQGLIFDGVIAAIVMLDALIAYLAGKWVKIGSVATTETTRGVPVRIYLKNFTLLSVVPHRFIIDTETGVVDINEVEHCHLDVLFKNRGYYADVLVLLQWQDPLGFFSWSRQIKLPQPIWVYPKLDKRVKTIQPEPEQDYLVEVTGAASVRRMHWRATAALGRPVARQTRRRSGLLLLIVLTGDESKDVDIADLAASWWRSLTSNGGAPLVIVAGNEVKVVRTTNGVDKTVLRAITQAQGNTSLQELSSTIAAFAGDKRVILVGDLPSELRSVLGKVEVGG